jgi:hypothetical protein
MTSLTVTQATTARAAIMHNMNGLQVGESLEFVAKAFHAAFGEPAVAAGGGTESGTSIRAWIARHPEFIVEPDPRRDVVKITRKAISPSTGGMKFTRTPATFQIARKFGESDGKVMSIRVREGQHVTLRLETSFENFFLALMGQGDIECEILTPE